MVKKAVLGGTFDPVHPAHTGMARYLLSGGLADEVIFLPAPQPPHKAGIRVISPYQHRRAMLERVLERGMTISDMECERTGKSYTFDTLTELRHRDPETEYCWIIGSDSLRQLHTWYRARELAENFSFLTFPRGGEALPDAAELGRFWPENLVEKLLKTILHHAPVLPDSSTEIRETIRREGVSAVKDMLDPRVLAYIQQHKLYQ